jgi:hypothetical protein
MTATDKLAEALRRLFDLYGYAWDRVGGGLMMMDSGIERFEAAHEKACAALAEYGANPGGWRSMDSAPRDGRDLLIVGGTYDVGLHNDLALTQPVIAFWDGDHWHGPEANARDEWRTCRPAYWQPLPTPPAKEAQS